MSKVIALFFCKAVILTGLLSCSPAGAVQRKSGNAVLRNPVLLENSEDTDLLLDHISGARMVLLGEASHGTYEFYEWRKKITKRLLIEQGFDFVVVEGDWPAFYSINKYVTGDGSVTSHKELFSAFDRWPPWMWRNQTIVNLVEWLREFNTNSETPSGLYGMDVYGISSAYNEVVEIVLNADHYMSDKVVGYLECFGRYVDDMHGYARSVAQKRAGCQEQLLKAQELIQEHILDTLSSESALNLEQCIGVLVYGERHFRAMADAGLDSWNVRVEFMNETINNLLEFYGAESRGVVWAHNTHIGDARATSMAHRGSLNIGQLLRESLGEDEVRLVGFGTAIGTVKAGRAWGAPGEVMEIPQPPADSYEYMFSKLKGDTLLFLFDEESRRGPLMSPRGHRAIGVVYQPEFEHRGNFVATILPLRYDAFIFFQSTKALYEWKD